VRRALLRHLDELDIFAQQALTRAEKSMPLALASRVSRFCTSASRYTGRFNVVPAGRTCHACRGEIDLGGHLIIGGVSAELMI